MQVWLSEADNCMRIVRVQLVRRGTIFHHLTEKKSEEMIQ